MKPLYCQMYSLRRGYQCIFAIFGAIHGLFQRLTFYTFQIKIRIAFQKLKFKKGDNLRQRCAKSTHAFNLRTLKVLKTIFQIDLILLFSMPHHPLCRSISEILQIHFQESGIVSVKRKTKISIPPVRTYLEIAVYFLLNCNH